jgi:hypothetical protein
VTTDDSTDRSSEALDHAWNWFSLHAGQRMQSFNFFLAATAFLVAGYAAALEKQRPVSAAIALLGAWISFWFNRLERRTKQLVKAGEDALQPAEDRLADSTGNPALRIVAKVETKAPGTASYSKVIDIIEWTTLLVFAIGFLYAVWPAIHALIARKP